MKTQNKMKKRKLSRTSAMHYAKLFFRAGLFLAALALYLYNRINDRGAWYESFREIPGLLQAIWLIFMVEMFLRMFPAGIESMGCQKQFARNFIPNQQGSGKPELLANRITWLVAGIWILFNAVIGLLYYVGWIDEGILFLICLAYSVCDMICILFFCPFQTWFMKNRCCTTCRIYNWDFAMMFTPLVFTTRLFTWSLLGMALIVLIQWEVTIYRHPERFSEETNLCLTCGQCTEKLCHHKTQLRSFWKQLRKKESK